MPRNPNKTRCQQPGCRAWAVRGSDPPLCSAHAGRNVGAGAPPGNQNRTTHGFYSRTLHADELADLLMHAGATPLDAEIAIARVALRRVLDMLRSGSAPGPKAADLTPQDRIRLVSLAFQGTRTIARLLRVKEDLHDPNEPFQAVMNQVLDELGQEWDIEL